MLGSKASLSGKLLFISNIFMLAVVVFGGRWGRLKSDSFFTFHSFSSRALSFVFFIICSFPSLVLSSVLFVSYEILFLYRLRLQLVSFSCSPFWVLCFRLVFFSLPSSSWTHSFSCSPFWVLCFVRICLSYLLRLELIPSGALRSEFFVLYEFASLTFFVLNSFLLVLSVLSSLFCTNLPLLPSSSWTHSFSCSPFWVLCFVRVCLSYLLRLELIPSRALRSELFVLYEFASLTFFVLNSFLLVLSVLSCLFCTNLPLLPSSSWTHSFSCSPFWVVCFVRVCLSYLLRLELIPSRALRSELFVLYEFASLTFFVLNSFLLVLSVLSSLFSTRFLLFAFFVLNSFLLVLSVLSCLFCTNLPLLPSSSWTHSFSGSPFWVLCFVRIYLSYLLRLELIPSRALRSELFVLYEFASLTFFVLNSFLLVLSVLSCLFCTNLPLLPSSSWTHSFSCSPFWVVCFVRICLSYLLRLELIPSRALRSELFVLYEFASLTFFVLNSFLLVLSVLSSLFCTSLPLLPSSSWTHSFSCSPFWVVCFVRICLSYLLRLELIPSGALRSEFFVLYEFASLTFFVLNSFLLVLSVLSSLFCTNLPLLPSCPQLASFGARCFVPPFPSLAFTFFVFNSFAFHFLIRPSLLHFHLSVRFLPFPTFPFLFSPFLLMFPTRFPSLFSAPPPPSQPPPPPRPFPCRFDTHTAYFLPFWLVVLLSCSCPCHSSCPSGSADSWWLFRLPSSY